MGYIPHVCLDLSNKRRAFLVMDVHGEYSWLDQELTKVAFDPEQDVLIIGGDLADRGPESHKALEWIKRPWVYRTLGNHDLVPRLYLQDQLSRYDIEEYYGGKWFTQLPCLEIETIASQFEDAPLVMTVVTPGGRKVGIAHADCFGDWNRHLEVNLQLPRDLILSELLATQSRQTINAIREAHNNKVPYDPEQCRVLNISHVFHGHTVMGKPFTVANRTWLDTGACFGYNLTVIDIDEFLAR